MARQRSKSEEWGRVPGWVYEVLPGLRPSAQATLFLLVTCPPPGLTILQIASILGVDPRTAKRAVKELALAGVATYHADVKRWIGIAPIKVELPDWVVEVTGGV